MANSEDGLEGKIVHRGTGSFLVIEGLVEEFEVEKLRDGVYELIEQDKLLILGTSVDLVIVESNKVVYYCESVSADEAELDDIEIED